jgi:beta-lactamase class A
MHIASRSRYGAAFYNYGQPRQARHFAWSFWFGFLFFTSILGVTALLVVSGLNYRMTAKYKDASTVASAQVPSRQPTDSKPQLSVATPDTVDKAAPAYDPGLRQLLIDWTKGHPRQQWSVVVEGLDSHTPSANINADLVYQSASIYKLMLMYSLLQKTDFASLSKTNLQVQGRAISLQDCASAMLKVSDNYCGDAIGNLVGWAKASDSIKKLGLDSTNLNSSTGATTTAADAAIFLKALNSGPAFTSDARDFILNTLKQQTYRSGIPAGCKGCEVANKTGDLSFVRHDIAIIKDGGSKYVLTIFTNGASYYQVAQLTTQIQNYIHTQLP